jgi:Coenzyme PQQ synthesis protein D (PqqD)
VTIRFRVNTPNVIFETIEGEVILIDLTSGTYYSLRDTGAAIWQALAEGASQDEIAAALQRRYEGAADEIHASVRDLVRDLEREGLIRPDEGREKAPGELFASNGATPAPFGAPKLEKHTDMQDLILIDPVHEVGAEGWPHPAESGEGST